MRAINTFLDTDNTEFEISYTKWLQESFSEPRIEELDEMEKHFYKCLTVKNRIVTQRPLNNPNYNPIIGA